MKIKDLGRAILDFELNTIPQFLILAISLIVGLLFKVLRWVVSTYKSMWHFILIGCLILFFVGLEKDCTRWCSHLIDLNYQGYAIREQYLFSIIALIVGIVVSFKLDKKMNEISNKYFPKNNA